METAHCAIAMLTTMGWKWNPRGSVLPFMELQVVDLSRMLCSSWALLLPQTIVAVLQTFGSAGDSLGLWGETRGQADSQKSMCIQEMLRMI